MVLLHLVYTAVPETKRKQKQERAGRRITQVGGRTDRGKLTPNTPTMRKKKKKTLTPVKEVVAHLSTLVGEGSFLEILCLKEIYDKFK